MPTASASPPKVITLMVWPMAFNRNSELKTDSGIEMQTINVLRQLPRKSRIIKPVRPAASRPSCITLSTAARTKID